MNKRALDLVLSLLSMAILAPIILALAAMVWLMIGRPVLFRQQRPGKYAKPFHILKFRTMSDLYDGNGSLLPDGQRLSKFGAFFRSTSLDELPALWNVLVGEMSLVGPRPLLMQYLPLYSERQALRHNVRPGVTGWAQVNGRNGISWEEKFDLDVWYVENQSMMLDLKIIALTLLKVFSRKDISAAGEATMRAFEGNQGQSIAEIADRNCSRK
jgi:lipopolysaccharide/colanic/teichoic acid biosynthesis glycosyltransferase